MRARSWATTVLAGCALTAVAVASAAGQGAGPGAGPGDPAQAWTIALGHPEGDWSPCFEDPAVLESLMTADLPVSSATATLRPGSTEADVARVVLCLDRSVTGGTLTVDGPED